MHLLICWARAGNKDVDDTAGTRLPARQSSRVEDTDESTNEVVGIGFCTEIAAVDRALHQDNECAVDETARAFDEAHGAARNSVHGGKDELFAGHVVDEEKHPASESFQRRHRGGEAPPGCRQLFDFAPVNSFDQGVSGGKVTVERAWADCRLTRDVVEGSFSSVAGEGQPGNLKDALAVALRIRAGLACGGRWQ